MTELGPKEWKRLLERIEGPTFHQVAIALADAIDVAESAAYDVIGAALDDGTLVERDGPGALPYLHVVEAYDPDGATGVPSAPTTEHYESLVYGETVPDSYGEAVEWDAWIPTCSGMNGKLPFAKYHDHPALEAFRSDEYELPESDPRYSWSDPSNWVEFDTANKQVRLDPELVGRAFIMQREGDPYTRSNDPPADPFLFADGDKVIDEDGEPIPEYVAAIELLAGGEPTWQEISGSETGAHALLRGRLPEGSKTQYIQLREEPLEEYDEAPMLELYEGPKVAVLTGDRVARAPEEYATVDEDGLQRLMAAGTAAHPNVLASAGAMTGTAGEDGEGGSTGAFDPEDVEPGLSIDPTIGPEDAPDDLPKCYERALTARYVAEKLPAIGNHGVNLYAALLAVHAGYDADEATEHFVMYPPDDDRAEVELGYTRKELRRTERKVEGGYQAPSVSALRRAGLFDVGETCDDDCPIHNDGTGADEGGCVALLPELDGDHRPKRDTFGSLTAELPAPEIGSDGPPSIADVHARTADEITDAMEQQVMAVVDGIMGGGKTWNAIGALLGRGEAGTYLSGRTDLYEQAREYAAEHGIPDDEIYVLPTPDDCPVWTGEYGDEWRDRVRLRYELGATMSKIHANLEDIPCCAGDRECPYRERNQIQWRDQIPLRKQLKWHTQNVTDSTE